MRVVVTNLGKYKLSAQEHAALLRALRRISEKHDQPAAGGSRTADRMEGGSVAGDNRRTGA